MSKVNVFLLARPTIVVTNNIQFLKMDYPNGPPKNGFKYFVLTLQ